MQIYLQSTNRFMRYRANKKCHVHADADADANANADAKMIRTKNNMSPPLRWGT